MFTGSFNDLSGEQLPPELYSFCRWVIEGSSGQFFGEEKSDIVHKRAISLAQTVVGTFLKDRQRRNKKSEDIKSAREMPQKLAVGLAPRQAIRSKGIVNMLHGFGVSVKYNRLRRVEAQIEESVINRIQENNRVYLPPDFVKNRYLFLQLIMLILVKTHLMEAIHFMVLQWRYIRKLRMGTRFQK